MIEISSIFTIATAPLPAPIKSELDSVTHLFYSLLLVAIASIVFFHYLEKIITRYFTNRKKLEQKNDISNVLATEQNIKTPDISPTLKKVYFSNWSMDLLKSLEHNKFIQLCAILLNTRYNLKPKLLDLVVDYGFNANLYKNNELSAFLRCEVRIEKIHVNLIREFSGVMGFSGIKKGYFISAGSFSEDSMLFVKQAASKNYQHIFLVSGENLLKMILSLPKEKQKKLLEFALKV